MKAINEGAVRKAQWPSAPLHELTEPGSPITYGVVKPGEEGVVLFVRGGDLADGRIIGKLRTITRQVSEQYRRTLLRGGELLISLVGRPGQVAVVPPDLIGANIARQVGLIRLRGCMSAEFVSYYLQSPDGIASLGANTGGSVQLVINLGDLRNVRVPIPPLPEQQRIVGILDEAFDGIATPNANAEKNLQNARALFESHLQAVFTQRGEGWAERRFEELVDAKCSLSYGIVQPGGEYPNGLPIVRPTDLTTKVIQLNGLKRIDPVLAGGYRRTGLTGGELLLCVRGSTGVVSIASEELANANVTRGIVPIRFDESHVTQKFGYYVLASGPIQKQIRQKTYGAALMQINIRDLRKILVPFPPLPEQERITAKLDSLSIETQRLEAVYRQKLAALGALKKSLLDQAFTGTL